MITREINWTEILEKLKIDTTNMIVNLIVIALLFVIAHLLLKRISALTSKAIEKAKKIEDQEKGRRVISAMTLTRSVSRYVVYFLVIILILHQVGFGGVVNNVLVTAGIGSIIISLGAQSMVKDVLSGFFFMFEHQFSVGDFVKINEQTGIITAIGMRVTYMTNTDGQKVIIPNGQIDTVINYTNTYNIAKVVVPTPYEADTARVLAMVRETAMEFYQDHSDLFVEEPAVYAITAFSDSSIDMTIRCKVQPLKHWEVERGLRMAVKERFDREGISIPYQQIVLHSEEK